MARQAEPAFNGPAFGTEKMLRLGLPGRFGEMPIYNFILILTIKKAAGDSKNRPAELDFNFSVL